MPKLTFPISKEKEKQLLKETVEQLQDFINETYTISNEVSMIATTIDMRLFEEYRKTVAEPCENGKMKSGLFEYNSHGVRLMVDWEWTILPPAKDSDVEPTESAHIDITQRILHIKVTSVGGAYNHNGILESIQHEVLHLFERQKRNKPYTNINNYKVASDTFEKLAITRATTEKEQKEKTISGCIASIIYMTYKFEQRAFYNGAYRYIMQSRRDAYYNFDELLHETRLFRRLMDVKFCVDELSAVDPNDSFLRGELEKYNLTLGKVLRCGRHLIYRLNAMIVRLRDKVMTDIFEKAEFRPWPESYSPRNEKKINPPKTTIEEILRKHLL